MGARGRNMIRIEAGCMDDIKCSTTSCPISGTGSADVYRSPEVLVVETECCWSGWKLALSGQSASVHECSQPHRPQDAVAPHEGTTSGVSHSLHVAV